MIQTNFDGMVTAKYEVGQEPTFEFDKYNPPAHEVTGSHVEPGYWFWLLWDGVDFLYDWGANDEPRPMVRAAQTTKRA